MGQKLQLAAQRSRALTRDPSDRSAIEADILLADVAQRNLLPMECRLLEKCNAMLQQGEEDDGVDSSLPGRLLVFLDWLVFVPSDAAQHDIRIHLPSLMHVRAHGRKLVITPLPKLSSDADMDSAYVGAGTDQVSLPMIQSPAITPSPAPNLPLSSPCDVHACVYAWLMVLSAVYACA